MGQNIGNSALKFKVGGWIGFICPITICETQWCAPIVIRWHAPIVIRWHAQTVKYEGLISIIKQPASKYYLLYKVWSVSIECPW